MKKETLGKILLPILFAMPFLSSAAVKIYKEEQFRKETFANILQCSGITVTNITYDFVKIRIFPSAFVYVTNRGTHYTIHSSWDHAVEGAHPQDVVLAEGFYDYPTGTIYLPERNRRDPKVLGHEYLHALGQRHGSLAFTRCGLNREQIEAV